MITTNFLIIWYSIMIPIVIGILWVLLKYQKSYKKKQNFFDLPNFKNFQPITLNEILIPEIKSSTKEKYFFKYDNLKVYVSASSKKFKRENVGLSKLITLSFSKATSLWSHSYNLIEIKNVILAKKKIILVHNHGIEWLYYSSIETMYKEKHNSIYIIFKKINGVTKIATHKIVFLNSNDRYEFVNQIMNLISYFPPSKDNEK